MNPFFAIQRIAGSIIARRWLAAGQFTRLFDRRGGFVPSSPADRQVKGDSVQPGVKGGVALERPQLEVGLNEGILDDIVRLVGGANHVDQGVVKSILIPRH